MPSSAAAAAAPASLALASVAAPAAAQAYSKYYEFFRTMPAWSAADDNTDANLTPSALLAKNVERVVAGLELMLIALGQEIRYRYMEPASDEQKQMQAANILSLNRWIAAGCQMDGALPLFYQEEDASFTEAVRASMQELGLSKNAQHITYDQNLYERFRKCFFRETWPSMEVRKRHLTNTFSGYNELRLLCQIFLAFQAGTDGP